MTKVEPATAQKPPLRRKSTRATTATKLPSTFNNEVQSLEIDISSGSYTADTLQALTLLYSRGVEHYNRKQDDKRAVYYELKLQDLLVKNDLLMREAQLAKATGSHDAASKQLLETQKKMRADTYVKNTAIVEQLILETKPEFKEMQERQNL